MNIKNNKKSKDSIAKIHATLCNIIKERGHKGVTIKYICEQAHINRTTFYAHYDSIEDALYHICEEYIMSAFRVFLEIDKPYKERIRKAMLIIKDNKDFFKYVFANVHNLEIKVMDILESNWQDYNKVVVDESKRLSLTYRIAGLVSMGKMYFADIKSGKTTPIDIDTFVDIVYDTLSKDAMNYTMK